MSSTTRRGQYAAFAPSLGGGVPHSTNGPKSNEYVVIGGHSVATKDSSSPQRFSPAMPGGWIRCVDTVSEGNRARSTSSTLVLLKLAEPRRQQGARHLRDATVDLVEPGAAGHELADHQEHPALVQ